MPWRPAPYVWRDYGFTLLAAVVFALGIRFFGIEAYRIPTAAMRPTLEPGDTIFVSKYTYGLRLPGAALPFTDGRAPERGEVVLFSTTGENRRDYIKRVIGLPGEMVAVNKGKVYIKGQPLRVQMDDVACGTEMLPGGMTHPICWEPPVLPDFPPQRIPTDSVFVLGDLRSQGESTKSKAWGQGAGIIPVSQIRGQALWIWLSINPRSFDPNGGSQWFPQFRFERMFRSIQ